MTLVTVERYQAITGDTATPSPAVSARLEDATDLLEGELGGRLLRHATRTETMYVDRQGRVYPKALPITDGGAYTIDGATLRGPFPTAWPDLVSGPVDSLSITYSGGYVERTANPSAVNRLPVFVEADIAWQAYYLGHPEAATGLVGVPAGALNVALGDAQVSSSVTAGGIQRGATAVTAGVWSPQTLRLRRRRVGIGVGSPW